MCFLIVHLLYSVGNMRDYLFNMWEVEDATAWLLDKLTSENHDQLIKISLTFWAI